MTSALIWQTVSTNSDDTERLGELLGNRLKGGEVIELRSDLGGGKTTFMKGLVKGTASQARVSSPTFTLSRIYKAPKFEIHHFDFYRLTDPGILADQLAEAVSGNNVVVIEWAGIVKEVLPRQHLTIEFKPTATSPDERVVTVTYTENYRDDVKYIQTEYEQVKS